jgi:hypothetical protein
MLTYSQRMRTLAEIDEKIAQEADLVSDSLNKALSLNQKLQILYGQCPAAQTPPQIIALRLEGKDIEFDSMGRHLVFDSLPFALHKKKRLFISFIQSFSMV